MYKVLHCCLIRVYINEFNFTGNSHNRDRRGKCTNEERVRVLNLAAYKRGTSYASTRKQSTRVLVSDRLYCVL